MSQGFAVLQNIHKDLTIIEYTQLSPLSTAPLPELSLSSATDGRSLTGLEDAEAGSGGQKSSLLIESLTFHNEWAARLAELANRIGKLRSIVQKLKEIVEEIASFNSFMNKEHLG